MAKSLRASTRKSNNQKLKRNVFGPVEAARNERLSAKLMEIATQPKEAKMDDVKEAPADQDEATQDEEVDDGAKNSAMDVDSGAQTSKKSSSKRIEKRPRKAKSAIAFTSYKDRVKAGNKKRR